MAVKVVRKTPANPRKIDCDKCQAGLEFTNADVKQRTSRDMSQVTETYYWIICPNCGNNVTVGRS